MAFNYVHLLSMFIHLLKMSNYYKIATRICTPLKLLFITVFSFHYFNWFSHDPNIHIIHVCVLILETCLCLIFHLLIATEILILHFSGDWLVIEVYSLVSHEELDLCTERFRVHILVYFLLIALLNYWS